MPVLSTLAIIMLKGKDLKECFFQNKVPRIFQLQKPISSLSQMQSSFSNYFIQYLGITELQVVKKALHMKLAWKVLHENSILIMHSKYIF